MNNSLTMELLHSLIENEGEYLEHHGIMGMKWGVRRYQNEDGSYTEAGRKRYGIGSERKSAKQVKRFLNENDQYVAYNKSLIKRSKNKVENAQANLRYAERKGKEKKIEKYKEELEKWKKINKTAVKDLAVAQSDKNKVLDWAKQHYDITIKDTLRNTSTMSERVAQSIGMLAFNIVGVGVMPTTDYTRGAKYKVKNVKDGRGPGITDKRNWTDD